MYDELYQAKFVRPDNRELFIHIYNEAGIYHLHIHTWEDNKRGKILLELLSDPAPLSALISNAEIEASLILF